jgi:hypothetical protein
MHREERESKLRLSGFHAYACKRDAEVTQTKRRSPWDKARFLIPANSRVYARVARLRSLHFLVFNRRAPLCDNFFLQLDNSMNEENHRMVEYFIKTPHREIHSLEKCDISIFKRT